MFNTAYRIINDKQRAEDIMQESFLNAFSKLDSLKDDNMFGAWLKRIVTNNSLHYYKKYNTNYDVSIDEVLYKVEDETTNGLTEQDNQKEQVKYILNALNDLKSNYKISLTLHLIEGYDYEEISEIMSISYANCRTMISRAKESLRKRLHTQMQV